MKVRSMSLSRRAFLGGVTATTIGWSLGARAQDDGAARPFLHGVASGDPLPDRIILWTRVTPGDVDGPVDVRWLLATDPALTAVVGGGTVRTSAASDFTVKVDAGGLEPGRTYYYAFDVGRDRSPVGRTKSAPDGPVDRVRLASLCCSNYPAGYFTVYRHVAARNDLDAVVHLGDYIYEYGNGVLGNGTPLDRVPAPDRELRTLDDYRQRYAQYRTDADLQAAHRQHPFVAVWDDHELANNAWRAGAAAHDAATEGPWVARRDAAWQAYREWMPIREAAGPGLRLYRRLRFGSLVDLLMLDTRTLRDEQVGAFDFAELGSTRRTMLGAEQESWLHQQLRASTADGTVWRVLGQQVLFSPLMPAAGPALNPDNWDGYRAERRRLLELAGSDAAPDVAILSGDFHSSWAFDVPLDPWDGYAADSGAGSRAVEVLAPPVSSPPLFLDPTLRAQIGLLRPNLPHLRYVEGDRYGYVLVDVTAERLQAEYHLVPDVRVPGAPASRAVGLTCARGTAHLVEDAAAVPSADGSDPAP
jgi:alkaline phosphatase D